MSILAPLPSSDSSSGTGSDSTRPRVVTLASRVRAIRPATVGGVILLGVLVMLIGLPMWQLVAGSFRSGDPFQPGAWTLDNYRRVLTNSALPELVRNSLLFAGLSTALCLVVGVTLAWIVTRTDVPGARAWQILTIAPLLIPGLMATTAWSVLLSERTGLLNVYVFEPLFGWRFNILSLTGMVWVQSLTMMPLVFILVGAALRRADSEIEHAGRVAGAGPLRALTVTLGAIRPAILTSALLVFVVSLESIEVPLIFGFPARIQVFSGEIYRSLRVETPTRWGEASALSTMLVVAVVALFAWYVLATRKSHRYVTIGSRVRASTKLSLGRGRWIAFAVCVTSAIFTLVLPFLSVLYASVVDYVGRPSAELLGTASLDHFTALFDNEMLVRAVKNSLLLGFFGGIAVVLLATVLAVLSMRHPSAVSKVNDSFSLVPMSVPRIALAPAFLWAYLLMPFGAGKALYGTLWIMGIAYVAMFLPIASRQISSQIGQVSPELESASRVAGAGPVRTALRITAPLVAPALAASFFLAFITFFREFAVSALMYRNGTEVFSVAMFSMLADGEMGQVAALSVVFMIVVVSVLSVGSTIVAKRKPSA